VCGAGRRFQQQASSAAGTSSVGSEVNQQANGAEGIYAGVDDNAGPPRMHAHTAAQDGHNDAESSESDVCAHAPAEHERPNAFLPFEKAVVVARSLGLASHNAWWVYCMNGENRSSPRPHAHAQGEPRAPLNINRLHAPATPGPSTINTHVHRPPS